MKILVEEYGALALAIIGAIAIVAIIGTIIFNNGVVTQFLQNFSVSAC